MPSPLLQTKLFIPPSQGLVSRPQLIQRLDEGFKAGKRLFLVSAQAGSGKTSLLSEWAAEGGIAFAWLSLDEGDNDPGRFWLYCSAALQRARPGVGQTAMQLLASPQPPPVQTVLISLLNDLAAQPDPLILALDDYHCIANPEIHSGITFLLEHLPARVGLAIATRADPPLPVARWRARGQLAEIRAADLRFSAAEAAVFLNQAMGLDLDVGDIQALEARTEGWIAGLQLAALALKAPSAPLDPRSAHEFIATFSGSHHFILEYLAEEVLARQTQQVQDFLVRTCILERMSASLCEAVISNGESVTGERGRGTMGEQDPGDLLPVTGHAFPILSFLEHSNLFLISLDQERQWYRYHHLFADLLANRLRLALPAAEIRALHVKASDWLAEHDFPEEAIQHALAGQDFERAAGLVEREARGMMFTGRVNLLKSWLTALPEASIEAHPRLKIYQQWIVMMQGTLDLSVQALLKMETLLRGLPPSPENEALRREMIVILGRFVALAGGSAHAISLSQEALDFLPEADQASRARVYSALAIAYGMEGEAAMAEQAYHECLRLAQVSGNYSLAAHTMMLMGSWLGHYARLREAAGVFQAIIDLGEQAGLPVFYPAGQGLIGLASMYLEWNELARAEDCLKRGLELCLQAGQDGLVLGTLFQSRLHQAQGDPAAAVAVLRPLEGAPPRSETLALVAREIQARLALGDMDGVVRWAAPLQALLAAPPPARGLPLVVLETVQAALARVFLAQGKVEQVFKILSELQSTAEPGQRLGRMLEVYLLRALAYQQQNQGGPSAQALASFELALELAEPEGYVLLFLEEGAPVLPLLQAILQKTGTPERLQHYEHRLLQAFAQGPAVLHAPEQTPSVVPPISAEAEQLVEPLSARELEILRLIAEGCSNQEIASQLVITLHTVKKHSSNIFSKLGVNSRTQALARAHQLGLI